MRNITIIINALVLLVCIISINRCNQGPKIITKTKVEYIVKTDTINQVFIEEVPKIVYVEKIKTEKGKDSIIYVDVPSETTIEAKEFKTQLYSNDAKADLKIISTGEVLDVKGNISWKEKSTTNTIFKNKSGLFLYGETSINPSLERIAIGLDYQIKNTVIIGSSVSYDNFSDKNYVNIKLGVKIW